MNTERYDFYAAIHKALRMLMAETLVAVGRVDVEDPASVASVLARIRGLLDLCTVHVEHENDYVHPAIAARAKTWDGKTAHDHEHHVTHIAELRAAVARVESAQPGRRASLLNRLYRDIAVFVADNYLHMEIEQSENNRLLWAHYTDEELLAIEHGIVASFPPDEVMATAPLLAAAATPADRAAMLNGMRQRAPEEVFNTVLERLRPMLSPLDRQKLAFALDDFARAA